MTVEYTFINGIYTAIFRGEGTLIDGTNLLNEATAAVIESYSVIGESAFENAIGLTSIVIPASVTNIGFGAFENAIGLTSINIPASVTSIGDFAFFNATGLKSIIFTGFSYQYWTICFSKCNRFDINKHTGKCNKYWRFRVL